jgi:hypothetical protein
MKPLVLLSLLLLFIFPLNSQERPLNTGLSNDEQLSFIGMMMKDVVEKYGPPRTVAAARGIEPWQDDVVFQYTGVDFYIFKDRVWQVKFTTTQGTSFFGISNGEPKSAVLLTLGNRAQDRGDHILLPISGKDWPLMLRVNFNNTNRVNSIFLYRPDF